MSIFSLRKPKPLPDSLPFKESHYRDLKRRNIIRLLLTYLAPLILLILFFFFQHNQVINESQRLHLRAIAESQSNTLDLFLSERLVNLSNLIDDPKFQFPPGTGAMQSYLNKLQSNSEAFVDIGYFDPSGIQIAYSGPYPMLEKRNYSSETWYINLLRSDESFIITDIYLGFREQPHFTIGVKRQIDSQFVVLRATLSPEKIYDYIRSIEGSSEVYTSIVNTAGYYQLVTPHIGTHLETSSFVPPREPRLGSESVKIDDRRITYAYSWLRNADWALITQWASNQGNPLLTGLGLKLLIISTILVIIILLVIFSRAEKLVEFQMESDRTRAQLEHAAKLASVGELAAGIAHEINNPLAVINEEAGLAKDLIGAEFGPAISVEELVPYLDTIQESVFRCRDITRKLLAFVRRTDLDFKSHDIHKLIDGVVDGILGKEIEVSNINIERTYDNNIPELITDGNQLQQVILNILKNGIDAIEGHPGKIQITTELEKKTIRLSIADSGKGMGKEQLEHIFVPFYTTKEVGKGTGLGLSVSYGIIKNLGGKIEVYSKPGEGSCFTITLPLRQRIKN